jgi:protein SCO1/2
MPPATVVFVTTDPERDSPERLRDWLDQFPGGERFVGLRGSLEEVTAAETAAQVPASIVQAPDEGASADDYEVGHAAQIMAYTADDKAHLAYPFGVRSEDWESDLPRMVDEWGSGSSSSSSSSAAGAGASSSGSDSGSSSDDGTAVTAGDLTVSDAFAAASEDLTAVYVTIDNAGDDDTLVGVRSPAAGDISMMSGENGAGMQDADEVDIPNGTTAFAAGGSHIMVTLDDAIAAGDTLPLELEFAKAGKVDVDVEVLDWDQMVDRVEEAGS